MKIVKAFPPNYSQIRAAFPYIRGRAILFAFGDRIYYPGPGKLSTALIEHETVHGGRQGSDPAGWWAKYIVDAQFRLDEEIPAHRAEYRELCRSGATFKELDQVARRLCSPLYGAGISLERAREWVAA